MNCSADNLSHLPLLALGHELILLALVGELRSSTVSEINLVKVVVVCRVIIYVIIYR